MNHHLTLPVTSMVHYTTESTDWQSNTMLQHVIVKYSKSKICKGNAAMQALHSTSDFLLMTTADVLCLLLQTSIIVEPASHCHIHMNTAVSCICTNRHQVSGMQCAYVAAATPWLNSRNAASLNWRTERRAQATSRIIRWHMKRTCDDFITVSQTPKKS